MKVVWLCSYPISLLNNIPVTYSKKSTHYPSWIVNLSEAMIKYGEGVNLELHIVSETPYISKSFFLEQDNIKFHIIRSASAVPFLLRGFPDFFPFDVLTSFHYNKKKLLSEIDKIRPDIIHSHGTEYSYSLTAIFSNILSVISIQGIVAELIKYNFNLRYFITKYLEKRTIRKGKHFIAKSPFAERYIRALNTNAMIYELENPVNEKFFNTKRNKKGKFILFVGSIIREKGIEVLLKAMEAVPNVHLKIIGSGKPEYIKCLNINAFEYGIHNRIEFLGQLNNLDIIAELENASILVLPSFIETSPNVIAEAMCAGVPVIGTNIGGIPYFIQDGQTGFLIPPNNSQELASKINLLINDSDLMDIMGRKGQLMAINRFHPTLAAKKIISIYNDILRVD